MHKTHFALASQYLAFRKGVIPLQIDIGFGTSGEANVKDHCHCLCSGIVYLGGTIGKFELYANLLTSKGLFTIVILASISSATLAF